jgi:cytochrome c oxidase assembly protein subunit 15
LGVVYDGVPRLAWREGSLFSTKSSKNNYHMIVALLILCATNLFNQKTSGNIETLKEYCFQTIVLLTLILTFVQIVLGTSTSVRWYQVKLLGYDQMALVLENHINFYIHRSSSLLILGLNLFFIRKNMSLKLGFNKINWVMSL